MNLRHSYEIFNLPSVIFVNGATMFGSLPSNELDYREQRRMNFSNNLECVKHVNSPEVDKLQISDLQFMMAFLAVSLMSSSVSYINYCTNLFYSFRYNPNFNSLEGPEHTNSLHRGKYVYCPHSLRRLG